MPNDEKKVLEFWKKKKIFEKLRRKIRGAKRWSFLDGPITANNPMGVHHAWGRTYKDLFQRFRAMLGFDERFQNGFDCQGLWVEVEVEKELGFKTKKDIEKYGIARFVEKCKERVRKYSGIQTEQSIRLGQWMDWENSYYTMSDENNYAIWNFLKVCREKNLIYKGHDAVAWCPRCETAISQHEMLTEDYKELTHDSIIMQFPIVGREKEFLLVWTTTPWTIIANIAVAVDAEADYSLVSFENSKYVVASKLVNSIFKSQFSIFKTFKGKELVGLHYKTAFDNLPAVEKARKENPKLFHSVIPTDNLIMPISLEEGTGMVHTAVSAGEEDFKLGKKLGLPMIPVIADNADYLSGLGEFSGQNAKKNPRLILDFMGKNNFSFSIFPYRHRYPACWRCKTELVWKVADEWYISMDGLRDKLISAAEKIKWIPGFGLSRELDWLKNMHDWLISKKNRYWGLTLPIFECSCGNFEIIGGKKEMIERAAAENNYFILRHTESESNVKNIHDMGDSPLTVKGKKDLEVLAKKLSGKKIDLIFASDILRTKIAAEAISKTTKASFYFDPRLREIDLNENPINVKLRMMAALSDIDQKYKNKNILIVSHGDPLWILETAMKGSVSYIGLGEFRPLNFKNLPYNSQGELEPHRPYMDKIKIKCPNCGKIISRILDVGSPWLDAGIVPFSTMPKEWFPADLVCESFPGQFKNWFYSLIVMSVVLKDVPPMKIIFGYALMKDEQGEEMHKSKGNTIWFDEAAEKTGVEPMRWVYLRQNPEDNLKFGWKVIEEARRKLLTLWNSFVFFKTYNKKFSIFKFQAPKNLLDCWILSKLNNLIEKITENLNNYKPAEASEAIEKFFVDDLSLWYIRRSRERFQRPRSREEKERATEVLHRVLIALVKIMAPFLPFLSEEIYQELGGKKESVHLEDWPKPEKKLINKKLEEEMDKVREIVALILAKRAEAGIKIRQPLAEVAVPVTLGEEYKKIIAEETNIKKIINGKKLVLNTKISESLKEEGDFRELVRNIQDWRKKKGLKPGEKVKLNIEVNLERAELIKKFEKQLKKLTNLSEIKIKIEK